MFRASFLLRIRFNYIDDFNFLLGINSKYIFVTKHYSLNIHLNQQIFQSIERPLNCGFLHISVKFEALEVLKMHMIYKSIIICNNVVYNSNNDNNNIQGGW